mgnify:CR=1 FL=1
MMNWTRILRQSRAIVRAGVSAPILALAAGPAAGQQNAPAAPGTPPRAAADAAASAPRRISIKEALQQEFQRDAGRPADKLRWLELEWDEAARTALQKSLSIQSAGLGKDLSAAALQQALALFDLVVTQSLTDNRNTVYNRTVTDQEWKKAINCTPACTSTLANNPGVYSLTFDQGRSAGFYQTEIDASVAPDTGPMKNSAYNAQITKLFAKGASAFAANSLVHTNNMYAEDIGFKVIGSYARPWTNNFSAGISSPLPGSKFFGDYALADVAVKIADTNQQAAFWQVTGVINSTLLSAEQGYWNLVLAQKIYEVTAATRERVRALAEKTERLFRMQEATRYDKAKLDAQMTTLKRQEHEALNGFVAASNALANLLDLDRDTILLPMRYEPRVQESASIDLQDALRQGLLRNPQVRLAEVNKSIATTLYEQGRVQLKPDLSANAIMSKKQSNSVFGFQSASDALGYTFRPDSTSQTYSLNYTRPWDNRAAKANYLQTESRFRQQEILLDQTRRNVSSQIALAVTNLQSAEQRTGIAKQSRDLAERVFNRAEKQRTLGVVSDFEVIAKSIDLLNADLDYETALLGRKISEAAAYAAIGSLAQRYGEGGRQ